MDHVTKSLWPFYKRNGKKYKKRMASRRDREQSRQHLPMRYKEDNDSTDVSSIQRFKEPRVKSHELTRRPSSSKNYPIFRRLLMGLINPKESEAEEVRYVTNSVAEDYIPQDNPRQLASHRAQSRHHRVNDHHRQGDKPSRKSRISARMRKYGRTSPLQNDHGLCNFNSSWIEGAGKK